jgi:hypothetical protein
MIRFWWSRRSPSVRGSVLGVKPNVLRRRVIGALAKHAIQFELFYPYRS